VLAAAPAARANDLDAFGFGARQQAMGSAFTGLASDFTAAYYNPAGLIQARHYTIGLGYQYVDYHFNFDSQSPGSISNFSGRQVERIEPLRGITLGLSGSAPRPENDDDEPRLGFGIGLFMPSDKILTAFSTRETEVPDYFLYGKRRDKLGIYPAVALRLVDGLSVGAGVAVLADLTGETTIDVASVQGNSEVDFDQDLKVDVAPNFGILWRPFERFSIGATY
jgi:long-chain fatty acid transport protein